MDVKEEVGRESDLNGQWTLSEELVNMSMVSKETVVQRRWGSETQKI